MFYEYDAADMQTLAARRAPHRAAHLALVRAEAEKGHVLYGGAWADAGPMGALILWHGSLDASAVESFVARDPYVSAGLVKGWKIRPWTVVVEAPGVQAQSPA